LAMFEARRTRDSAVMATSGPKVSGSGSSMEEYIDSYNITHVVELENVKLVIRILATGWGSGLTPTAARAMESHVATIRLIKRKLGYLCQRYMH
jgi:hypothetical protein